MTRMRLRATSLNPNNFRVLLRFLPTSSAKLRISSMAEGIGSLQFVNSFHTSSIISKPMSYFHSKTLVFENPFVFPYRWMSTSSNQQSLTVSYLVKSLGLSPRTALSVSKHVNFENPKKPEKVINFFTEYGFTQAQMSSLFRKLPSLLLSDTQKTIFPKLEFFEAKGFSRLEIAKMISAFPSLLKCSVSKQIVPSHDFLKSLFQSDQKVILAVKQYPDILTYNVEKHVAPKLDILREHGVPDANIATLVLHCPRVFMHRFDRFRKVVEKVKDMGFSASNLNFVLAVKVFLSTSKATWESRVDAYTKWGWSQEDFLNAFLRRPRCMIISEDKLAASMDFFINQMGVRPCLIAKHPILLSLSVKERLIPRFSVFQVLLSKGLVKREVSLVELFKVSEKQFLQRFVTPYKVEAPELLYLYQEKLNLANRASDLLNLYSMRIMFRRVKGKESFHISIL